MFHVKRDIGSKFEYTVINCWKLVVKKIKIITGELNSFNVRIQSLNFLLGVLLCKNTECRQLSSH